MWIRYHTPPPPQIPNQGRGLFPTTHIPAGHTILTESPLAAVGGVIDTHPKPSDTLYAACDWQPLHAYCMEQGGWRFPLLTAQLLCRGIMERSDVGLGAIHGNQSSLPLTTPHSTTMQKVSMLCHANVPHPPPEWRHAHHLLTEVLTKQGVLENNSRAQEMVSWESYLGVLARCHINAFRYAFGVCVFCVFGTVCFVEVCVFYMHNVAMRSMCAATQHPPPHPSPHRIQHVSLFTTMLQDGLAAAASAAVAQDSGVHVDDSSEQYEQYNSAHTSSSGKQQGSALYWLASFFNHACSPNVLVSYPGVYWGVTHCMLSLLLFVCLTPYAPLSLLLTHTHTPSNTHTHTHTPS